MRIAFRPWAGAVRRSASRLPGRRKLIEQSVPHGGGWMSSGRGSLSAALWGLRRGPGMLGLVAEDRLHLGALEGPVASCDLRLELTRCPAGVADEDPQTVHGIVAAKQLEQQLPVRAQVDSVTGWDRVLGWCGGAKQEPHGPEVNGSAEVHL